MPAKKSIHKFAPSAKKTNKGSSSSRASRRRYSCTKHIQTHTHRHELLLRWCECKQKADQTRAQYTLAVVVVVPTRIAANVEQQQRQTNQTGRAEPAANANKQQQQRQRKQLRRRFCGDCTFFQHTTRNTPPCGAQSASTATAAAATVPIRKVFQCSPASRRVVTNVARVVLSCAVYVDVCLCERVRERCCLPSLSFITSSFHTKRKWHCSSSAAHQQA